MPIKSHVTAKHHFSVLRLWQVLSSVKLYACSTHQNSLFTWIDNINDSLDENPGTIVPRLQCQLLKGMLRRIKGRI